MLRQKDSTFTTFPPSIYSYFSRSLAIGNNKGGFCNYFTEIWFCTSAETHPIILKTLHSTLRERKEPKKKDIYGS
jgi:hypothetical protein